MIDLAVMPGGSDHPAFGINWKFHRSGHSQFDFIWAQSLSKETVINPPQVQWYPNLPRVKVGS
jgi:hypothetical protein